MDKIYVLLYSDGSYYTTVNTDKTTKYLRLAWQTDSLRRATDKLGMLLQPVTLCSLEPTEVVL